jgi:glutaconyl-CoA/methylmalonyl-CoA decarboxylase subunit gamma
MPGQIIRVDVEHGQHVQQGDILMILEAMKMEHQIIAPTNGTVATIYCSE